MRAGARVGGFASARQVGGLASTDNGSPRNLKMGSHRIIIIFQKMSLAGEWGVGPQAESGVRRITPIAGTRIYLGEMMPHITSGL